ncbi:MAG: response regulator [Deltaproteobacteria bacterium]|nr:response regulator [Deltaproteobacteria bacterium]
MKTFFRSLRISNKIAAIFLLFLFMMGVGGGVGLYNASKIAQVTRTLFLGNFRRMETLAGIEKEFMSQRQASFMHIIVQDAGSKSFLGASMEDQRAKIDKLVSDYRAYDLSDKLKGALSQFGASLGEYRRMQESVTALSLKGDREAALTIMGGEGNRSFNKALNALKNLIDVEKAAATDAYESSEYFGAAITLLTLFFTLAGIVIGIYLWFVLTRSLVRPVLAIEESAKRLSKGDLKQRAQIFSNDEIGSLAREFNVMAESMEGSYVTLERKVDERTEELKAAYEELASKKMELEIKNEELMRASRMKSQFLANVSHELRTPLNSIIGFSELLQEKSFGELNEKQSQYVKFVHTSGGHLLQLINSILDLSKIEAGRMELMLEEFTLTDVLGEILGTIKPLAHKKNVLVETKFAPASPVINADKGKFKQIMYNLLSNAVKFNVDGGRVVISWEVKDEPVGMSIHRYLYISVKDTGVGIKEEDFRKLFKEFEQLDPTITREHGGTGLGLALTKKLVELHKGHIWVESKAGKGSTFMVKLPQGTKEIEVVAPPSTLIPITMEPRKEEKPVILVAGESADINHLLEVYLTEDSEFEVVKAFDGNELVEKAVQKRPFAIVMGITLPKKDGWEALKELKERGETKDVPVVIISAANNRELGFALGAVDYLVKPVDKERLLETIGRLHFTKNGKKRHLNILVVDDEPQVLTLLGDILEKEGFGVLKASGGEEAVKMAIDNEPDLLILDLMMPGVSGFDVVERLREHPATHDIPIVIFTAKDITKGDKERLGTSIKKIIRKAGFSKEDLLAEVRLLELAYPEKANMVDPTTALFNRRYFDIILQRELSRTVRYGGMFSILLVDIDDFGGFNRSNGVTNGDEALRELARLFSENLRKADCVTRYGGDEFAILLPSITGVEALQVAEKLRAIVDHSRFPVIDGKGNLTVSIGMLNLPDHERTEIIDDLRAATKRLYIDGGNKVMVCAGRGGG